MSSDSDERKVRLPALRVQYGGQWYERDLTLCRRVQMKQAAGRDGEDVAALAQRIGVSMGTVYAWLNGTVACTRATSERIVAGLGLTFEEVHRPVDGPGEVDSR
jgi:hypothetical protein